MIAPGSHLGAFELIAPLGAGGQGELFLARPRAERVERRPPRQLLRLQAMAGGISPALAAQWRLAALKIARSGAADSLHDEHRHLASPAVAHQHLGCLYSRRFPGHTPDLGMVGKNDRRVYLALAYEPGLSLERILRGRRRPLDGRWSVELVRQLAAALAHLHSQGIVHHDVRPANVIVRPAGAAWPHATLIDLGAAETPATPRRRAIYGVHTHLPPERTATAPAPASPLVDLYALGLLLRTLTAGIRRSPALAGLIDAATAAEPGRRAASLPDLAAMLDRLAVLPEARRAVPSNNPVAERPF